MLGGPLCSSSTTTYLSFLNHEGKVAKLTNYSETEVQILHNVSRRNVQNWLLLDGGVRFAGVLLLLRGDLIFRVIGLVLFTPVRFSC